MNNISHILNNLEVVMLSSTIKEDIKKGTYLATVFGDKGKTINLFRLEELIHC